MNSTLNKTEKDSSPIQLTTSIELSDVGLPSIKEDHDLIYFFKEA